MTMLNARTAQRDVSQQRLVAEVPGQEFVASFCGQTK